MAARTLGSLYFNNYYFEGRRLDGRSRGESASFPIESDQGATVLYAVKEEDCLTILDNVLGTTLDPSGANSPAKHPDFDKLYAVSADFAPLAPKTWDAPGSGLEGLGEAFSNYKLMLMTVRYQEDRRWVESGRASVELITTQALVPASGGQKAYFAAQPIPFSGLNLTLSRRRMLNFDPDDITATYCNHVNADDWTLPSGRTITAECALLQTFSYDYHNVSYGPKYYSVNLEFIVKPQSWNLYPARKTGDFEHITYANGSDLYEGINFDAIIDLD